MRNNKFVELGSEASYNYKDGGIVRISTILNYAYGAGDSEEAFGYKVGDIIEAGWLDKEGRKSKGIVLEVWQDPWDFEDETNWMMKIQRLKEK